MREAYPNDAAVHVSHETIYVSLLRDGQRFVDRNRTTRYALRQILALDQRQAIRVAGYRGRQHLDRHLASQIRVGRPIHLAHAAGADGGDDLVRAEASAGYEGQIAVD